MLTKNQVIKFLQQQTPFLKLKGVKRPYINSFECDNCGKEYYTLKCCKSIWCPICNWKQAIKLNSIITRINKKVKKYVQRRFITLTFKNIDKINSEKFKEYRQCFIKKFIRNKLIKQQLIGGFYAFDWTISERQRNHPFNIHIHLFGFQKGYLPAKRIKEAWLQATGDSYIIDSREVNNINFAIFEVAKYIQSTKSIMACQTKRRIELMNAVQKIRRFSRFGIAYKIKLEKKPLKSPCCKTSLNYDYEPMYPEQFGDFSSSNQQEPEQRDLELSDKDEWDF